MSKVRLALVCVLMISLLIPYSVQASQVYPRGLTQFGIPPYIADYKTLTVFTSADTMCMHTGYKRLVLQATEQVVDAFLHNSRPKEIVAGLEQALSLTMAPYDAVKEVANWHVEVVGPETTLEEVLSEHQKWNEDAKISGCITLAPVLSGSDWTEIKSTTHPSPGYAEFEDLDAGTYTDDNAQSVYIVAPSTPNNNEKFHVLNNARTNGSTFYLLQDGLYLVGSSHHVSWTDTTHSYVAQFYSMSYTAGHTYWADITYTNGAWWMCALDTSNQSTYTCILESSGVGTTLVSGTNTAVWIENQITNNATWYSGWPTSIHVYGAKLYRNGTPQNWSSNHRHTIDSCTINYPPSNALSGSLVSGGNGYFLLAGVPLDC